jgi:hypothetical protein
MAKVKIGSGNPTVSEATQAPKTFLDLVDVGRELNVSPAQVQRLIARGSIGASKVGDAWKVEPSELVRFVKSSPSVASMARPESLPSSLSVIKAAEGALRRAASAVTSDRAILQEMESLRKGYETLHAVTAVEIPFNVAPPGMLEGLFAQLDTLAENLLGRAIVAEVKDRFGRMLADPLGRLYESPTQYKELVAAATRRALAVVFVARETRTVAEEVGRVQNGDSIEVQLRRYLVTVSYSLNASSVLLAARLQAAAQRVL